MPLTLTPDDVARFQTVIAAADRAHAELLAVDAADGPAWDEARRQWILSLQAVKASVEVRIVDELARKKRLEAQKAAA